MGEKLPLRPAATAGSPARCAHSLTLLFVDSGEVRKENGCELVSTRTEQSSTNFFVITFCITTSETGNKIQFDGVSLFKSIGVLWKNFLKVRVENIMLCWSCHSGVRCSGSISDKYRPNTCRGISPGHGTPNLRAPYLCKVLFAYR
jgi:hypothetical protein